ncbi:transporter [uncultured Polaribacter sp.]|uniref:transporter n=1 Tax=uncultured Polaribacter sp. TaxID=174711 RepID=UPI00260513F9|nr:transporter [uncultured Polaribacter sp.]
MRKVLIKSLCAFFLVIGLQVQAQENDAPAKSNVQTYTPSKLLNKGQWDIKFFNNLYTETKGTFNGVKADKARENYFTSTLEVFTGVSENNRINVGLLLEYRSNTIGGRSATAVFDLGNDVTARKGLSSFAPAIKFQPLENVGNFSIQSAFHIPIIENETENGVFLDQTAYTFQNRFFYDYTLPSGNWQLFTELNTEYNFGEEDSFANKTFLLAPGVFMSYFPSDKSTVLGFVQHAQRFGDFTQDYTALGFGGKYQLTDLLNLEVLYSKFIRGNDTGLGQSFNIGLRALF